MKEDDKKHRNDKQERVLGESEPRIPALRTLKPIKPVLRKTSNKPQHTYQERPTIPNPLQPTGKFAHVAALAGDGVDEELHTPHSNPSWGRPILHHTRPTYKQILKPAQGYYKNYQSPDKSKIESLLDEKYDGEDDGDEAIEASVDARVPGLEPLLLPHQIRGVAFMASREAGRKYAKGGILADEMGLGKTVQSIALILSRPAPANADVKTTLVIAPLAVMDQWKDEIESKAPGLSVMTHQGPSRTKSCNTFKGFDVVVTTYNVVTREVETHGALFQANWYRIIADEAHEFRNHEAKLSKAMTALQSSDRRWALTGTPVHNKIHDLYSLFRYLRVEVLEQRTAFDTVAKNKDMTELRRVLKAIMLRRSQRIIKSYVPPLVKIPKKLNLEKRESEIYNDVYVKAVEDFKQGRAQCDIMKTFVRLRQACDGLLDPLSASKPLQGTESIDIKTGSVNEDDLLSAMLGSLSLKKSENAKEDYPGQDRCKIKELRSILIKDRQRQTVVFSSFVTMLHTLRPMLEHEGIRYEIYDGSLNAAARSALLSRFRDEKQGITVLLCSLTAAAVGLNLTSASQVVLIEPWWNPQIVDQAVKRVHRLGQKNEVLYYEIYVANTVEERMLSVQDRKRKLAKKLLDSGEKLDSKGVSYFIFGDEGKEESKSKESSKSSPLPPDGIKKLFGSNGSLPRFHKKNDSADTSSPAADKTPPSSVDVVTP